MTMPKNNYFLLSVGGSPSTLYNIFATQTARRYGIFGSGRTCDGTWESQTALF